MKKLSSVPLFLLLAHSQILAHHSEFNLPPKFPILALAILLAFPMIIVLGEKIIQKKA